MQSQKCFPNSVLYFIFELVFGSTNVYKYRSIHYCTISRTLLLSHIGQRTFVLCKYHQLFVNSVHLYSNHAANKFTKEGRKITEESRQRSRQGCQQEGAEGVLLYLHLQGVEAGAPRHWHLQQGHEHHELFC